MVLEILACTALGFSVAAIVGLRRLTTINRHSRPSREGTIYRRLAG